MDDSLKNLIRSLPSCEKCRRSAEKFNEGFRHRALTCAGETKDYWACDDCLRIVVEAVRTHQSSANAHFEKQCPECDGDFGRIEGSPLVACISCGRVYRTDRGSALVYTGVRYEEIKEYARLLKGHGLIKGQELP